MTSEDYQVVFIANGQLEADMYRLSLEAAGIPVITRRESAGAVYGLTVGPLGIVNILVPAEKVEEAIEMIAAIELGELENSEDFTNGIDENFLEDSDF